MCRIVNIIIATEDIIAPTIEEDIFNLEAKPAEQDHVNFRQYLRLEQSDAMRADVLATWQSSAILALKFVLFVVRKDT